MHPILLALHANYGLGVTIYPVFIKREVHSTLLAEQLQKLKHPMFLLNVSCYICVY